VSGYRRRVFPEFLRYIRRAIRFNARMSAPFVHHVRGFAVRNTTTLDTLTLLRRFASAMDDWPLDGLRVWVRASRGADYSGTCYTREGRIYINLAPRLTFPYELHVQIVPGKTTRGVWRRPTCTVAVANAYDLCTFIYLHECYHWLIQRARRNGRCKEAMCDRFATRHLVDACNCTVRDARSRPVPRSAWDIQDLDAFVARARRQCAPARAQCPRAI